MNNIRKSILIIEDEESLCGVLAEKFGHENFDVFTAKDGLEGFEKALKVHPDIILLDILLPKMDGTKMLEKLREDDWGKNALVMVLSNLENTGKIPVADIDHGGVYEYLVKADCKVDDVVLKVKTKLGL